MGIYLQCLLPGTVFFIDARQLVLDMPGQDGLLILQLGSQKVAEQMVIAHPAAHVIHWNTEDVVNAHKLKEHGPVEGFPLQQGGQHTPAEGNVKCIKAGSHQQKAAYLARLTG
jgi:hypothetical protein